MAHVTGEQRADTGAGTFTDEEEITGRSLDVQEAALTLFSSRGYHGTTMKHLAGLLGVQAPSLYNHVVSKQEILQRIMLTGMRRLLHDQDVALARTDDLAEQLREMTNAHVLAHIYRRRGAVVGDRHIGDLEEPVQSEVREMRERYEHRFRAVIQSGVEAGLFDVTSVKLASFAIIEMATSVVVWFKEDGPLTPNEVAREYGEMALRIVGAGVNSQRRAPASGLRPRAA